MKGSLLYNLYYVKNGARCKPLIINIVNHQTKYGQAVKVEMENDEKHISLYGWN